MTDIHLAMCCCVYLTSLEQIALAQSILRRGDQVGSTGRHTMALFPSSSVNRWGLYFVIYFTGTFDHTSDETYTEFIV